MDEDMEFFFFCAQTVALICVLGYYYSYGHRDRVHNSILSGESFVDELLIGHERNCFDLLRVSKGCYVNLSNELRQRDLLADSRNVTVEEQLAIFLFTIAHNERNRVMQNRFQHSGETISRYFNKVLSAILRLCPHYIKPAGSETPPEIATNPLFNPYFKDCIGAIDGTHIPAWVRSEDQVRYQNRKGFLSQNVMVVVSFDMRFQYVFAGWEGSASDSKILQDALWRRPYNRLQVPTGKYYLVDAGYANTRGFIAPYRGVRYHLKEWLTTQAPQTPKELYNLRHSKLRNVVERTFAVLKQRFPILQTAPRYPLKTQAKIVVACCFMHNYIKQWNYNDDMEEEHAQEMDVDEDMNFEEGPEVGSVSSDADTRFA
ncbi:putative nuclease HARBI1 [Cinnamomum micranthum f. kanehirae]|uniref:Putative nuclease HARBI1 n=1 Tax=Cinnamomum micranthum f. kanehirae TaxID=337451 RepID=A0A3S4P329_9MAGN|nr:putative nuclease HARBI1 [Cinnamomum micranthum f. kanehirae]